MHRGLNLWEKDSRRIKFFTHYAQAHRFDPLEIMNWPRVKNVLQYHGSINQALFDLFPDIGLDASKLKHLLVSPAQKRKFF